MSKELLSKEPSQCNLYFFGPLGSWKSFRLSSKKICLKAAFRVRGEVKGKGAFGYMCGWGAFQESDSAYFAALLYSFLPEI